MKALGIIALTAVAHVDNGSTSPVAASLCLTLGIVKMKDLRIHDQYVDLLKPSNVQDSFTHFTLEAYESKKDWQTETDQPHFVPKAADHKSL